MRRRIMRRVYPYAWKSFVQHPDVREAFGILRQVIQALLYFIWNRDCQDSTHLWLSIPDQFICDLHLTGPFAGR